MHSSTIGELASALAKAQAEMTLAEATATNPFFKSKYTDMATYVRSSRPSLTKNGLSVSQFITSVDGTQKLCTMLMHSSGEYISSVADINPPKTDIQSLGSYLTYLKRYMYSSIVGCISGSEDDDGESAMARPRPGFISQPELSAIKRVVDKNEEARNKLFSVFKIDSLDKIPAARVATVMEWLNNL